MRGGGRRENREEEIKNVEVYRCRKLEVWEDGVWDLPVGQWYTSPHLKL